MKKVIIIAEAGVNHNGDIQRAKELIDVAASAGVDFVKFQSFKTENLVSKSAKKAEYQTKNINDGNDSQFDMLKALELSEAEHEELIEYCKEKNISFFSTAFDLDSLKYLSEIGLTVVKIPSGEITNLPYLELAARLFKRVIISTGMSTMSDIEAALNVFIQEGLSKENITILHCNTEYPTPMEDVNLKAMLSIGNEFGVSFGYSDHTEGIEVPIAAVALGATVIEKHFTLDKNLPGPDHKASIEPKELILMCKSIRNIEMAISGSGLKEISKSEEKNIIIARKSIHIKTRITKGEIICQEHLVMKRPGGGISPMKYKEIIGKKALLDLEPDTQLKWLNIE